MNIEKLKMEFHFQLFIILVLLRILESRLRFFRSKSKMNSRWIWYNHCHSRVSHSWDKILCTLYSTNLLQLFCSSDSKPSCPRWVVGWPVMTPGTNKLFFNVLHKWHLDTHDVLMPWLICEFPWLQIVCEMYKLCVRCKHHRDWSSHD
jgi:hypothetical protein